MICLLGNHEAKFADFLIEPLENAFKFLTYGGAECALSYGVEPPDLSVSDDEMYAFHKRLKATVPKDHIEFINQLLWNLIQDWDQDKDQSPFISNFSLSLLSALIFLPVSFDDLL